jgi:ribonuclease HI
MKSTPNHNGYNNIFRNQYIIPTSITRKQIPPIHETFTHSCTKFKIHSSIKNKIIFPKFPPWLWKTHINTELTKYNKHETNSIIITSHFNFSQIYTDASKSHHGTGFAIIKEEIEILHRLHPESSIFTAENYAILEAIKSTNLKPSNNNVLIISDSFSALLALLNPFSTNEITQNIQTELYSTKKNIEFMRVPSHTGIAGNEMADKSPKQLKPSYIQQSLTYRLTT